MPFETSKFSFYFSSIKRCLLQSKIQMNCSFTRTMKYSSYQPPLRGGPSARKSGGSASRCSRPRNLDARLNGSTMTAAAGTSACAEATEAPYPSVAACSSGRGCGDAWGRRCARGLLGTSSCRTVASPSSAPCPSPPMPPGSAVRSSGQAGSGMVFPLLVSKIASSLVGPLSGSCRCSPLRSVCS